MRVRISPARSPEDIALASRLFTAYAESLGIDLAFQGFDAELAELPGKYAPPAGELLLAWLNGSEPAGCVGIRPLAAQCCEMKRLYVTLEARGLGIGKALVEASLGTALALGYREMRLDTLDSMVGAIALYRAAGFTPIAPYYDNPIPGALFFRRAL
jgi:GNAT superfamily N-acetyltransferase